MNGVALVLPTADAEAHALCTLALERGSKSFNLASRLLPEPARRRATVLYAFCRAVDDDIDLAPREEQAEALDALRARVRSVYRGESQAEPVWAAFAGLVQSVHLPLEYPEELLRGMEMDVRGTHYATLDDLLLYCHRVAGVVGLMMCHVLGIDRDAALRHAAHLGIAMQLTNICRDVAEDWRLGRLYVPQSLLGAAELGPPNALPLEHCPAASRTALACAVRSLLTTAEFFYTSAEQGFSALPPRSRLGVRAARHVYAAIGSELRRRGCDVLAERAVVPAHKKLWPVAKSLLASLWELPGAARRGAYRTPLRVARFPEDILPIAATTSLPGAPSCLPLAPR